MNCTAEQHINKNVQLVKRKRAVYIQQLSQPQERSGQLEFISAMEGLDVHRIQHVYCKRNAVCVRAIVEFAPKVRDVAKQ
jgi:hypothetical protein